MIQTILNWIQPLVVIVFFTSGVLCLIIKEWKFGLVNLSIAQANFFIFFGDKIFKQGG